MDLKKEKWYLWVTVDDRQFGAWYDGSDWFVSNPPHLPVKSELQYRSIQNIPYLQELIHVYSSHKLLLRQELTCLALNFDTADGFSCHCTIKKWLNNRIFCVCNILPALIVSKSFWFWLTIFFTRASLSRPVAPTRTKTFRVKGGILSTVSYSWRSAVSTSAFFRKW